MGRQRRPMLTDRSRAIRRHVSSTWFQRHCAATIQRFRPGTEHEGADRRHSLRPRSDDHVRHSARWSLNRPIVDTPEQCALLRTRATRQTHQERLDYFPFCISLLPRQYWNTALGRKDAFSNEKSSARSHGRIQGQDHFAPAEKATPWTGERRPAKNVRRSAGGLTHFQHRVRGSTLISGDIDHAIGTHAIEKKAVCSSSLKRKCDTLLPLLEHAIAYLHEFRVRFHVGLQIL